MYLAQRKRYILKVLSALVCFVFISGQIFPQQALARRSGQDPGGFNFGNVAMSVGISLGSMAVGSALNAGISSFFQGTEATGFLSSSGVSLSDHLRDLASLQNVASNVDFLFPDGISQGFSLPIVSSFIEGGILPATGVNLDAALELMKAPTLAPVLDADILFPDGISQGFSLPITSSFNEGSVLATGTNISTTPSLFSKVFSNMGDAFTKSFSWQNMSTNFGTFVAASQVGRAVGAMGQYFKWDPSTTFLVSSIATGATGGFLNPSVALGPTLGSSSTSALSTMARGALVGGLTGAASAGVIVLIDASRMDNKKLPQDERRPGVGAQIASMFAGAIMGNLARALVNPATYNLTSLEIIRQQNLANQEPIPNEALVYLQKAEQLQQSSFYIIPQRLLEAAFIKTADMWPQLAAQSLSIIAANSVSDKDERGRNKNDFLSSSLVSSLVQGVASPLFTSAAHYFNLEPGLYIGENSTNRYNAHLAQIAREINPADPKQGAIKDSPYERLSLFVSNLASKEILFGFTEGAIHGGTSYLISKISKNDPLATAAASYGATLVSAAIRGAVQQWMYKDDTIEIGRLQELSKQPDVDPWIAQEAAQKAEQLQQKGIEGTMKATEPALTDSIEDKRMKETRKQELAEYKAAMEGGYPTAILTSMAKANRDFLDRSLAFGAPRGDPKNITVLGTLDYLSKLNTYGRAAAQGPGWFSSALTSGFIKAGSEAISTDILTTLGATPIGGYFDIAPYTYEATSRKGKTYRKE